MTYKLNVTKKSTYLHVIVTGHLSKENVVRYFEEIHRECTARDCFRILIEERLEGPRLSVAAIYELVSEESDKSRGLFEAIAYINVNDEGDSMKFFENVAVNRGFHVRVFSTLANAEKWLLNKSR